MKSLFVFGLISLGALSFSQTVPKLDFQRGGDISYIPQLESKGIKFFDGGLKADPVATFSKHGWNTARLRVWVNPSDHWCDQAHTFAMAKRIKAAGMRLIIDFHYSDTWADPGHQDVPAAWAKLTHPQLVTTVRNYTRDFVKGLIAQGTVPYEVNVGNEVSGGMMWPDGKLYTGDQKAQWGKFTDLLKAGILGVKDAQGSNSILIGIHIDRGGDNGGSRYFYDQLKSYGVPYDLIGLSYYLWWQGPIDNLVANINDLGQRYGKDVVVAETMYPYSLTPTNPNGWITKASQIDSRFPATSAGQRDYLTSLESVIQQVPGNHGGGLVYWAPECVFSDWTTAFDNMSVFDRGNDRLPGMDAIGGAVTVTPNTLVLSAGQKKSVLIQLPGKTLLADTTVLVSSNSPSVLVPATAVIAKGASGVNVIIEGKSITKTPAVVLIYWAGSAVKISVTVTK
jgi:arabinogalactan endo-1,4-beta-galactosidase